MARKDCIICGVSFRRFGKKAEIAKTCSQKCYYKSITGRRIVKKRRASCEEHSKYTIGCNDCKITMTNYTREQRRKNGVLAIGSKEYSKMISKRQKEWFKNNEHPMLGKHHSEETKLKLSLAKRKGKMVSCLQCEQDYYASPSWVKRNTKFCSIQCCRTFYSGERNNKWKGGITPLKKKLRMSKEWKHWRELVFERDDHTCQECGKRGCYIEPHHIVPLRNNMKEIFNINNGITLCRPCHIMTMGKEEQFVEIYFDLLSSHMVAYGQ